MSDQIILYCNNNLWTSFNGVIIMYPVMNRVLLRVRMLYYLKVEVLGEAANQALEGIPARYYMAHSPL